MKYDYEDLSPNQFETLIVFLCQPLLGISVQGFSTGVDGGRDAKFVGTAERHPSKSAPWMGTTIIQAKHTNGYNKAFSDSDFFSDKDPKIVDGEETANTIIGKEILRIKKLVNSKNLEHYMLFANRRLAGNAESDIRAHISNKCGIPLVSIYLCGVEQLEILLKTFPEVPKLAALDPVDSPLMVSPDELAEMVQALVESWDTMQQVLDDPPTPRISYEEKNILNKMSAEYAKEQRKRYLKETAQIHTFLAAPENRELLRRYETVVDEFQLKIISKRKEYQFFDEIMEYLLQVLFNRDIVLRQNKRLTRATLFYMYWNCDIGASDAQTN
jgi:hypothetical protein